MMMSSESVRLVEAAYGALADRGVDAFAEYWSDDIEWQALGGGFRGRQSGRAYLGGWFEHFDDLTTEVLDLVDVGNERIVVWVRISGRSTGSGIEPPPAYFATVVEVRDGEIARAVEYSTLEEAVEAASAMR
jgi:ketosteroid isomerase-like protein